MSLSGKKRRVKRGSLLRLVDFARNPQERFGVVISNGKHYADVFWVGGQGSPWLNAGLNTKVIDKNVPLDWVLIDVVMF